jgi:hypothetical protein
MPKKTSYFWRTIFYVAWPLFANVVLAISSFSIFVRDFSRHPEICYVAALAALSASLAAFVGFIIHDMGTGRTMLAVAAQGAALIFIFAGIYRGYGLNYSGAYASLTDDPGSALYFSIVTWTTLGYGDFSPPPEIRLVAATQAILGYIFFGTAVGLGASLLGRSNSQNDEYS